MSREAQQKNEVSCHSSTQDIDMIEYKEVLWNIK